MNNMKNQEVAYYWVNQGVEYPENKDYVQAPYGDNNEGHRIVTHLRIGDKILSYIYRKGGVFRILTVISVPETFVYSDGRVWCRAKVSEDTNINPTSLKKIEVLLKYNPDALPEYSNNIPWNKDFGKVKQARYLTQIPLKLFMLIAETCNYTVDLNPNQNSKKVSLEYREGEVIERKLLIRERNRDIVSLVKMRDNYTCLACGFRYENKIVEAHHLIPLHKSDSDKLVCANDLITLCPNCHSIAHILLEKDSIYSDKKYY